MFSKLAQSSIKAML
ncbi:hypothetical protein ACK6E9_001892 [Escherichia coli]|nr:hypothetical protein [Escherichia coli]EHL7236086.1 hypothetical protein [Escherichia coli]EHL7257066.1 hypothetical protein [Escherichia coli]EHL7294454.1 hypothetical protein [Escherichia coli]EHX8080603.1 hypothetical protein [Escherichia coli]EHX8370766.1 hypothetical protein [Escherichia coli]